MNAYELADELENKDRLWNVDENLMLKNCAMLRQQADHIAELEKQLDECGHYEAMMHDEYMERIAELEKEKIRAYDNGYEDGQKALQNQAGRIVELEKEVKELTFKQESLCKIIRMRLNDVPRSQYPPR